VHVQFVAFGVTLSYCNVRTDTRTFWPIGGAGFYLATNAFSCAIRTAQDNAKVVSDAFVFISCLSCPDTDAPNKHTKALAVELGLSASAQSIHRSTSAAQRLGPQRKSSLRSCLDRSQTHMNTASGQPSHTTMIMRMTIPGPTEKHHDKHAKSLSKRQHVQPPSK
jgi:hypothetical protein